MEPTKNLLDFLTWLATGGGAAVFLAFILERIPAFQKLTADVKSWLTLGLTIALALGAYAILTYVPAEILAQVAPFFAIVAGVAAPILIAQGAHKLDPLTKANAEKGNDML